MKLGIAHTLTHQTPAQWAERTLSLGLGAVVFPLDYRAKDKDIEAYAAAAREHGLTIAEVGAWSNPIAMDDNERGAALEKCTRQLELAERVGARCCVNIAGAAGQSWHGGYAANYAPQTRLRIVESVRQIIDAVNPKTACYSLEPMQWMLPDSPESYLELMEEVNRPGQFLAHLDIANMVNSPRRYFLNEEFVKRCFALLSGRIRSCHIKDVHLEQSPTVLLREVAPGEGELNLAHFGMLAHKEDPGMPMIIEHLNGEEDYIAAVAYVRRLFALAGVEAR